MIKESKAMREIHEIREKLYKKRKHMLHEEVIADINNTAEEFMNKYHLKLRRVQKRAVGV